MNCEANEKRYEDKLMLKKISVSAVLLSASMTASAGVGQIPEPSTLGLFAAAAVALVVLTKFKK